MNLEWVVRKYQTTKHKVNEHLSGGEWIRSGLLESIKPTKQMFVNLVFSRFDTFEQPSPDSFTTTEMFVDLVFSRFDTF
jgi:hypothetical protein